MKVGVDFKNAYTDNDYTEIIKCAKVVQKC